MIYVKTVTKNLTISLPDELAKEMDKLPEVNWSELCRQCIHEYIQRRKGIPLEVPKGLTFNDFLDEAGIPLSVFNNYSEFMKDTLRDREYPRWYYKKERQMKKPPSS